MIPGLLVCAALLALPLHDLVRRPSLRRFALRNLVRRRSEALLVVGGSLLGTAIITAALVVGTTFETSVKDSARTRLGPIDERVVTQGPAAREALVRSLRAHPVEGTDGVLPVSWTTVSVSTTGPDRRAESDQRLYELDVAAARRFGGNGAASGFEAARSPAEGQVVLNDDLAGKLHAASGDTVRVFSYGHSVRLTVSEVVPQVGVAGAGSLFVAPGTIKAFGAHIWGAGAHRDLRVQPGRRVRRCRPEWRGDHRPTSAHAGRSGDVGRTGQARRARPRRGVG